MTQQSSQEIRAAGGIVRGTGSHHGKIAVVRRRRYKDEIGLPKGKVRKGETDSEAALREVGEETGLRVLLREPAGSTHYHVDGKPKTVTYFIMDALEDIPGSPNDLTEIEAVEWLTPQQAVQVLTHADDRTLLLNVFKTEMPL